jgi:hypothetical protein
MLPLVRLRLRLSPPSANPTDIGIGSISSVVELAFLKRLVVGPIPTWTPKEYMNMFAIIWLVVALILIIGLIFRAGLTGDKEHFVWVPIAMLWPLALVAAAAIAPFCAIYYFGKALGQSNR